LIYFGDIPEQQLRYAKALYQRCGKRRRKRTTRRACTIPFDVFCTLIHTQCSYCGAGLMNACGGKCGRKRDRIDEARVLHYNGLDRVDSAGIYEVDNVVPCCRDCNLAKNTMSHTEFCTWARRAAHHIQVTPALLSLVPAPV
jgi:5-methylcytosine-specific restriction endonuclease McrA